MLFVFFAIAAAHLFAEMLGLRGLSVGTKTLLMPSLAVWFWLETRQFSTVCSRNWMLFGLFFSWLGDCLLIFQKENSTVPYFLLGLGAFLVAHLFYLAAFVKFPSASPGFLSKNKWLLLPFGIFLATMDCFLWPSLAGGLRGPVVFYSFAITAMAVGAASLFGKIEGRAAQILFLGAVLFICSDSLLAVNKFHAPFANAGFLVMLTYILGQFGIAFGMRGGLDFLPEK